MRNINLAWTSNEINWLEACFKASYVNINATKF